MSEKVDGPRRRPQTTNSLSTAKIVAIGEAPGPAGRADLPLYPLPPGCSGARLFKLTRLSNRRTYLELIFRINLISYDPGPKYPRREAHVAATAMIPFLVDRTVVLLGRRVARAFGLGQLDYFDWSSRHGFDAAVIPHPSGRNLWYNSTENYDLAGQFISSLLE